ncbi:MAG: tRNA (adenosine(37)-N6)-threonylcarbamoyltransferase complex ATPase subunit type 1 TsaE [Planctomycetota bacterium]|jgi:tRNA threonylcarbamoyladenosine biosynthesis protein TsaE
MSSTEFTTHSIEETIALGRRIGELCRGGECLLLHGPLGAGKTCLAKGLAVGLGIPEDDPVVSPTFVLHVQYFGRLEFNHIDAYRLGEGADVSMLGFEELVDGDGVTAIEWAEYIEADLPHHCLNIEIERVDAEERRFAFTPDTGSEDRYRNIIQGLTTEPSEGS